MKTIRSLAVVAPGYPTPDNPFYPFVEQLVRGFADSGVRCTVIVPTNPLKRIAQRLSVPPRSEVRRTQAGNAMTVLRPYCFSMGKRPLGGVHMDVLTRRLFCDAVRRVLRAMPEKPDALYAHFLYPAGFSVAELSTETGIPAFVACGESSPALYAQSALCYARACLDQMHGIVAVSEKNRAELIEGGYLSDPEKARVFPNAVDASLFHPADRAQARAKLGIAPDAFVAAFVGAFIERKGVRVACRAFDSVGGVTSLFVGAGDVRPDCAGIAFQGSVAHDVLPDYLNAADVFVLPTLAEGCCNAIVEALACGLPVVSSDLRFNDGLLDETNAIRVDPRSESAVVDAVRTLRDDPALRARLARGALNKGRSLEIGARTRAILDFMGERIG